MDATDLSLLANKKHDLLHAAQEARKLSYSPYSKFRVGAALLTKWGEIILGANYENASYGGTVCAERTALAKALIRSDQLNVHEQNSARKIERGDIIAVAVASDLEGSCSPCGICRQAIREHCSLDTRILMVGSNWNRHNAEHVVQNLVKDEAGKELNEPNVQVVTLEYLLPMSFGPEDLDKPRQS
ncbi:related to CDD1 - cytidine deaminase [Melanopsichium pennsylvanicum]|uniref:Cytidine deaminase n=2 Tax=Melanopsichium pennsylvanicum TaxID=63383 RepID=A0AAJ4XIC5_9BASI|nr:related to CDD1-cytidine deaminase [Melanopsichium pennsylvanicum 4]SNX82927.1 related to CDD1 - cytidine deaminase [Melanopsichium pennsylvanicum]